MFKDYYAILDITENASLEQIKEAFKKQAIKWHPDKNINFDTTEIMQDINEAFLILKDPEGKLKYNFEYQSFKAYKEEHNVNEKSTKSTSQQFERNYYKEYFVKDVELGKWMKNASQQAVDLAKQTIKDFGGIMKEGCLASSDMALKLIISIAVATLLWLILFSASKFK